MNGLDLFSGIGGISLAVKQFGIRTVAYCESDRYAQSVLLSRMQSGDIDKAPIWDDVRTLTKEMLPRIDIITAGFPCQDISVAGSGRGLAGERSGLFFEIARLVDDLRPKFVFLENVPAITVRGLDRVLLELTALGYDTRWTTVSASSVGACHRRERWWLLAHSKHSGQHTNTDRPRWERKNLSEPNQWDEDHESFGCCRTSTNTNGESIRQQQKPERRGQGSSESRPNGSTRHPSNAVCEGLERQRNIKCRIREELAWPVGYGRWISKPTVCRGDHGIQGGMDGVNKDCEDLGLFKKNQQIKCLGNSVVPLAAATAFYKLLNMKSL